MPSLKVTAVIGAGFGDEGKGLVVDYLAAKNPDAIVVRFNGGAQAGHTVVRPERRHAFSHVGSGTFAGAATYLAHTFLVNPLLWRKEQNALDMLGNVPRPALIVDPSAVFTTPYDMLVNQELERARGEARHGSCGYGINETVTRSTILPGHICKAASPIWLRDFLRVTSDYSMGRMNVFSYQPSIEFVSRMVSSGIRDDFEKAMGEFLAASTFADRLPKGRDVIFEGAQGLLLDEEHEFFPHVTRSRTGLTNVITLARRNGISELEVIYVTRAYMTRHGAGPFPTEDLTLSYPDETNAQNEFQGTLRFGHLDVKLIGQAIARDLRRAKEVGLCVAPSLAVTCLDQVGDVSHYLRVCSALIEETGLPIRLWSYGPSRENVRVYAPPLET